MNTLIVFFVPLAVVLLLYLPLARRFSVGKRKKARAWREKAIAEGRQVTCYLIRERLYSDDPQESPQWKGTYKYYVFPGGEMYQTSRIFTNRPPREITLFVDEHNPRKVLDDHSIEYGKGPGRGLPLFLIGVVLFVVLVRFLGGIFPIA